MSAKYVKNVAPFSVDERGSMVFCSDPENKFHIEEVLWIESKKDAVRANHYHKKDTHAMYLVSGKLEYITKDMNDPNSKSEKVIVTPGQLILSPAMVAHKVRFLADSLIVCLTTEPRDQEHYESDTVRLEVED